MDVLTETRFWAQVIRDSECTVYCNPDLESRIKGWVDARGLGGVIKVAASRVVPEARVFVVDHNAIDASMRQAAFRDPFRA